MALGSNIIWEVRTTGADTNGGGFLVGGSGTDYSKQDAAQYALTGLTSSGAGNVVLSASAAANMVGNVVQCISGTNFNTGFFLITSVSVGVSFTCGTNAAGQSISAGVGASGVVNIGGALATIAQAVTCVSTNTNHRIYVKKTGTYAITASIAVSNNAGNPGGATDHNRIIGYNTTRGDGRTYGNQPIIQLTTNTGLTAFNITGTGWLLEGLNIDCNSLGTSTGIVMGAAYQKVRYCTVKNFTSRGINQTAGSSLTINNNEITGGTSAASAAIASAGTPVVLHNNIHDNACPGIVGAAGTFIIGNKITSNTGASSDGINISSFFNVILGNLIYGSGRDGIRMTGTFFIGFVAKNNIFALNGGYGFNNTGTAWPVDFDWDGNVYWNNTSGTTKNLTSTTGVYSDPNQYANTLDVVLSSGNNPFVDDTHGNFMLNSTAGMGLSCQAVAFPGVFFGDTTNTGYLDMGPLQHRAAGGGNLLGNGTLVITG